MIKRFTRAFLNWHSNKVYQYYSYIVAVELGVLVNDTGIAHTLSSHGCGGLANGYIENICMESVGEGNKAVLVS